MSAKGSAQKMVVVGCFSGFMQDSCKVEIQCFCRLIWCLYKVHKGLYRVLGYRVQGLGFQVRGARGV